MRAALFVCARHNDNAVLGKMQGKWRKNENRDRLPTDPR